MISCRITAILAWALCLLVPFSAIASPESNFRLIVTAGALSEDQPYKSFYRSRIFIGEENPPFLITDANVLAYESDSAIFLAGDVAAQDLLQATDIVESGSLRGFLGQSYRGFPVQGAIDVSTQQYLGAESRVSYFEKRAVNGKPIFAFAKAGGQKGIVWPKSAGALKKIPAIMMADAKGTFQALIVARPLGANNHRFGLVDQLLKGTQPSGYVDLGSSYGVVQEISQDRITSFLKRRPMAAMLGTDELGALIVSPERFSSLPVVKPFPEQARRTLETEPQRFDGEKINFWSVAGPENFWSIFGKLGQPYSMKDATLAMKSLSQDPKHTYNVVRSFSPDGAAEAAKSVFVDLVLLVTNSPNAKFPNQETIELKTQGDNFEHVAPIVNVSPLDVSEVILEGPSLREVLRVTIKRHSVNDSARVAEDVQTRPMPVVPGTLPELKALYQSENRMWTKSDFERVLGGIMIGSRADVAVFESLPMTTSISEKIPVAMAKEFMTPRGHLTVIKTTGKQVKRLASWASANSLSKKFIIYGMDPKKGTIGGRVIADNEPFRVALDESALVELFGISRLGGFSEDFAVRAPFIEGIYSDPRQLFYIGGPKVIPVSDTASEIERALADVRLDNSFENLVSGFLVAKDSSAVSSSIDMPYGQPKHVVTLDISNLDVGISTNSANATYFEYADKNVLPNSRGNIPIYAHLLLFTKSSLNYDAPGLQTSLFGEIKYMHLNRFEKPEKDKTKLGLKFRLPWERTLFSESSVVLSPVLKSAYETKLAPNFWSDHVQLPPRTQRIETLLGFNVDFTNLGFNFDVGGVLASDFNRTRTVDALDFGPGTNFYSKWKLFGPLELSSEVTAFYLFPLPQNTATKKLAMGVEGSLWLRFARFYDFSFAAVSDFMVASLQESPRTVALSSIFALTISYGRLFRLLG